MSALQSIPLQKKRIVLVDDHPLLLDSLTRLLSHEPDLDCCGLASTGPEAHAAVAMHQPDLVIMDLRLKDGDGLELVKSLKKQLPTLRILVLSQFDPTLYAERALRAGAGGYVDKNQSTKEVLTAIRTVLRDEVYLTRGVAACLLHRFVGGPRRGDKTGIERLTDRELHVLALLGSGLSTRKIASELNLSFKTVETHRENIKQKLGFDNASELVHYACSWAQEKISLDARDGGSTRNENREDCSPKVQSLTPSGSSGDL